jgi:hypothetical protein
MGNVSAVGRKDSLATMVVVCGLGPKFREAQDGLSECDQPNSGSAVLDGYL